MCEPAREAAYIDNELQKTIHVIWLVTKPATLYIGFHYGCMIAINKEKHGQAVFVCTFMLSCYFFYDGIIQTLVEHHQKQITFI